MQKTNRPHAKPAVFGGDIRRGTVILSDTNKPLLVGSVNFTADTDSLTLGVRQFGLTEHETLDVRMHEEVPLASISTAEFLLWEFSGYATLEGAINDQRYRGQLAE